MNDIEGINNHPVQRLKPIIKKEPLKLPGGFQFKNTEWQIEYLKELAASYNHACNLISDERDKIIQIANNQDAQIRSNQESFSNHQKLMIKLVTDHNKEKQELLAKLQIRDQQLRELRNGDIDQP